MSRQPNDVVDEERRGRDHSASIKPPSLADAQRAHCRDLGIDPDSVSEAVRILAKKFKRAPLEILWQVADDEQASKSARANAAMALMPYLHGKPAPAKPVEPNKPPAGVMEVPVAASMEEWIGIAGPSQAKLKATVRE